MTCSAATADRYMRSAARLVRAANGKKTKMDVSRAIANVKKTAGELANQLFSDGDEAPHEMALGIAAAVCGAPFHAVRPKIKNQTVAGAISTLYGATDMKARCVSLLALMDSATARASELTDRSVRGLIECLGQWLTELRCADGPCTHRNPHLAKSFECLVGAGTALSFAWHHFMKQMQAMQLSSGHYFAAVSAERSSCENLLWAYSCIITFKSAAAKDAAPTDVGKAKRKVEEETGAT